MRTIPVLLVLLAAAAADEPSPARVLRDLRQEFRSLDQNSPVFSFQKLERMRILSRVADIDDARAHQFLIEVAQNERYLPLHVELHAMMAKRLPDSPDVAAYFRKHLAPDDPHRKVARDYLLARAIRKRDDQWLQRMFDTGTVEDRFLALEGMGRMGSMQALAAAQALARSPDWQPVADTVVNCGTIATAVKNREGTEAARLLLVLRRDARFQERDEEALREATRLWANRNLKSYIRVDALADRDAEGRERTAAFMGEAGIEAARAPLVRMARDRSEYPRVRGAAAEALGGLAIAKGDLARVLAGLAADDDEQVRGGAIRGLARLRVRQAAEALVELLDGPAAADARAALAGLAGQPEEADWAAWLTSCDLPLGT